MNLSRANQVKTNLIFFHVRVTGIKDRKKQLPSYIFDFIGFLSLCYIILICKVEKHGYMKLLNRLPKMYFESIGIRGSLLKQKYISNGVPHWGSFLVQYCIAVSVMTQITEQEMFLSSEDNSKWRAATVMFKGRAIIQNSVEKSEEF